MKLLIIRVLMAGILLGSGTLKASSRLDGEYLHEVTNEFVTPHLKWGHPLQGGPIRSLFITHRRYGAREVVELAQRVDLDYTAFVAANTGSIFRDSIYESAVLGTSDYEKTHELLEKLRPRYDVIVLANFSFSNLSPEAQYHILKQVSEGTGLVNVSSGKFPHPKVLKNPTDDWRTILSQVDPAVLPGEPVDAEKLLKTYAFGKGRIGFLSYPARVGLTSLEPYTPIGWKARYENSLALAGRVIQWAAGREISASVKPEISPEKVRLTLDSGRQETMRVRLRDSRNHEHRALSGKAPIELDTSALPAGPYYVDVLLENRSGIAEFGVFGLEIPSVCGEVGIASDQIAYEQGETVILTITLEKALNEDAEVVVSLQDLPEGNLWNRKVVALPKGAREIRAEFPDIRVPTVAGLVLAEIRQGDRPLASAYEVAYFPRRHREIFPTILWSNTPTSLSEMYSAQLRKSVPDATALTHPGKKGETGQHSALFNERFVPYMTRIVLAHGKNNETLSDKWLGMTKEEVAAATEGDGSFYNPAVRDFWRQNIERRIAGLPEIGPFIYTLGDENSFSYQAGYSPADITAFAAFLRERYGDIKVLNREWNSSYEGFEKVERPGLNEMRDQSLYPLWNAHRSFMEKQYADVHHFLADEIRKRDPHALVGSEGSVPGDLEVTIEGLDFWGPYKNPVNDELLRSLGSEKLRTIWWGYNGEFMAYPLWGPLLKGIVNGNAWYSSGIEPISGLMSVDFSLANYYKNDRKPYVDALNRGVAPLLITTPLRDDGIALLWSQSSQSASVMDDRFLSPRDSAVPLMNHFYKAGLNFNYLTSKMLEKGALKNYKILWLPGVTALSEKEANAIEAFVEKGGVVVADLNPGILNASCGKLPVSRLAGLFGTPELKGDASLDIKGVAVEKTVRGTPIGFQAGKAYQSPEVPVFSVHEKGKGLAILLNFNLSSASNTAVTSMDDFLSQILALAAIRPGIRVEGISDQQLVLRLRENAENQVLGLLAERDNMGKTATIELPETAWVYEADKGVIGETRRIEAVLDIPFKVFTLFRSEQKAPEFGLPTKEIRAGESIRLDAAALSPHGVYRLEVRGKDNEPLSRFTKVFQGIPQGEDAVLRFALSDPQGAYRITLCDVRTGLSSTTSLNLGKPIQ